MRVWLVTVGEPVPTDGADVRLYRTGILCEMLARAGHDVTWWTSTFDHMKKKHRYDTTETVRLTDRSRIVLLRSIGYRRNVSIRRIVDHRMLARLFAKRARTEDRPDVIVCSFPTIELAAASVAYGRANGVPVVLDVRDLWPEIFLELGPRWMRPLMNVGLWPMWTATREALRGATAISGNTAEFVKWGLRLAGRHAGRFDRHFLFGYPVPEIAPEEEASTKEFWEGHGLAADGSEFIACFLGTVGRQFDLETVVDAAIRLQAGGERFKVVICGVGEKLQALKERASGHSNIVFPGWVSRKQIWMMMGMASVGLAPYVGGMGFERSTPNKVVEYLAAGLPIVSSLEGLARDLLDKHRCGVTYRCGDVAALAEIFIQLRSDRARLATMSCNAKQLFETTYSADKVYGEMIEYLCEVGSAGHSGGRASSTPAGSRADVAVRMQASRKS